MEEYKEHYTTLDNLSNKLAQDGVAVITGSATAKIDS